MTESRAQRPRDRGQRPAQREQPGHGHRSRADGADVRVPQRKGVHCADRDCRGEDRRGQPLAEKLDHGNEDQPGEDAARKKHSGRARPDDVAHTEILRREFRRHGRSRIPRGLIDRTRQPEKQGFVKELVHQAQAEAAEHLAGKAAAFLSRDQDVRTGRPLRVSQRAVLDHVQLAPQGNHEEDAQDASCEREEEHARNLRDVELEAEEDQRGEGEDDTRGDRLPRRARRLHNVVFKNRGLTQPLENADGKHRNRNGRAHRQARNQRQVNGYGAENDPQKCAERDSAECELGDFDIRRDVRAERGLLFLSL